MSKKPAASPEIAITRYASPDGPVQVWRIRESSGDWSTTGPDGGHSDVFPTAVEALASSDACRFESGTGLHIRTGGLISPFDLLPVLESWTDPVDDGSKVVDWSQHPALGSTQEVLNHWPAREALGLDPSRVMRVDNGFICVHTASGEALHLIVFRDADSSFPEFFERWAVASADNGGGRIGFDLGEIVPGLVGEVIDVPDWAPSLTVWPSPEGHPQGLYDSTVAWVAGCFSGALEEYELRIDEGEVRAAIPEDGPWGEGWGRLEPVVLRARTRHRDVGHD